MSKSSSRHSAKKNATVSHALAKDAVRGNRASAEKQGVAESTGAEAVPSRLPGKTLTRDAAKQVRRQAERQTRYLASRRARRNKMIIWTSGLLLCAVLGGLAIYFLSGSHGASAQAGSTPYTEPVFNSAYPPVENVYCDQMEMQTAHLHAHLSIWINGQPSLLPQGVGIPLDQQSGQPACFYWLHTHDRTGVIHIEAPVQETLTLGQFLDEWNQQFQSLGFPSQLLLSSGWTSWVNGHPFGGSFTSIKLDAHALITLAFNSPNVKPDTTYAWNGL